MSQRVGFYHLLPNQVKDFKEGSKIKKEANLKIETEMKNNQKELTKKLKIKIINYHKQRVLK